MLVALNAKESVDWDRLRISVCWLFLVPLGQVALTLSYLGQGTRLPPRRAREPTQRKADHEGRSASAHESQRTTVRGSSCTKATVDLLNLVCNHTFI